MIGILRVDLSRFRRLIVCIRVASKDAAADKTEESRVKDYAIGYEVLPRS